MNDVKQGHAGITLIELLITIAIAAILLAALGGVISQALQVWTSNQTNNDSAQQAEFAMLRMTTMIRGSARLLVPVQQNNPRTVLALTLDSTIDHDRNGIADADNDQDGLVDEDLPPDYSFDGAAGIIGIDDDGDGLVDEGNSADNNEDGIADGGPSSDDDGDGIFDEDWLDPVVYYLQGTTLIERTPNLNPANGTDFTEHALAENVTAFTIVKKTTPRKTFIEISLSLLDGSGQTITLSSKTRLGGAK